MLRTRLRCSALLMGRTSDGHLRAVATLAGSRELFFVAQSYPVSNNYPALFLCLSWNTKSDIPPRAERERDP